MTTHPQPLHAWASTLRGIAYGDAWGYPTEFASYQALVDVHGPHGPDAPDDLVVSDDTQMVLALAQALFTGTDLSDRAQIRARIVEEYLAWLTDPDNDRAPGNTCLHSLTWIKHHPEPVTALAQAGWADTNSKGCGANMRVAPAAFLPDHLWEPVAGYQAAVTHGHPTAVTAAILTARTIRKAAHGMPAQTLLADACRYADEQLADSAGGSGHGWEDEWLPGLAVDAGYSTTAAYLHAGWAEVSAVLGRALQSVKTFQVDPWDGDPCELAGEGWVADEALAVALLCVTLFPDDPELAIRRAATTGGDSDSIGAITGAIAGATDPDAWDESWADRLEHRYANWIDELTR